MEYNFKRKSYDLRLMRSVKQGTRSRILTPPLSECHYIVEKWRVTV